MCAIGPTLPICDFRRDCRYCGTSRLRAFASKMARMTLAVVGRRTEICFSYAERDRCIERQTGCGVVGPITA
jgi:hypothetical protein